MIFCDPSSVFTETKAPKYKIYSLSTEIIDANGNPIYRDNRDYLIQSEKI
jgi:DNA (cytosine-5)-methyltransferase 1